VARPGFALFCVVLMAVATALMVGAADFSRDLNTLRNPTPVTAESLAKGRSLYFAQDCPLCHGENGRGDGPLAAGLRPPPADFRVHMAAGHTDGQLFDWITNGYPGSAMPAYRDRLTEEERWYLITFMRSFANEE
jgi:mono/diheme cytochrome c family protein